MCSLYPAKWNNDTDFHPSYMLYGWQTAFKRAGVTYHMPTVPHTKNDSLKAIRASCLTVLEEAESLAGEVSEGYFPEDMQHTYTSKPFCLSILAHK